MLLTLAVNFLIQNSVALYRENEKMCNLRYCLYFEHRIFVKECAPLYLYKF